MRGMHTGGEMTAQLRGYMPPRHLAQRGDARSLPASDAWHPSEHNDTVCTGVPSLGQRGKHGSRAQGEVGGDHVSGLAHRLPVRCRSLEDDHDTVDAEVPLSVTDG